jgi:dihydrofolate reductase
MRKLIVSEFLSLDGVMQAPATADEDTEGGFAHGGWQPQYFDEVLLATASKGMAAADAYLFGRRTYQNMAAYWPTAPADDPFAGHLNRTAKYVASRTLTSVQWQNSTLIQGDVAEQVATLKQQAGGDIQVLGSGDLVRTLLAHDLVDELQLMICPVLLGGGKRLFGDTGQLRALELVESVTTGTGVAIHTYRPVR